MSESRLISAEIRVQSLRHTTSTLEHRHQPALRHTTTSQLCAEHNPSARCHPYHRCGIGIAWSQGTPKASKQRPTASPKPSTTSLVQHSNRRSSSRLSLSATPRNNLFTLLHASDKAIRDGSPLDELVSAFPKSRVATTISQSAGRAPFASTLRPNLTGGTLGRTAGGYGTGSGRVGGARYFSHGPASQAQVVQNVSQAVRAFFTQGHKAQYDGVNTRGEKRYKAVSALQEETGKKLNALPRATPGSRLEFAINPTITALTSLNGVAGYSTSEQVQADHLNTSGLLDVLSVDFSRALKDLAAILNDLKRLSVLGDLPITYAGSTLLVHFPGCDADTVDGLCNELGITRGAVVQDEDFDAFTGTEIALLFPFAPSAEGSCEGQDLFEEDEPVQYYPQYTDKKPLFDYRQVISLSDMLTPSSKGAYSTQSDSGLDDVLLVDGEQYASSPSAFESVRSGSESLSAGSNKHDPLEYQGFEGIYRFIEELDSARR
ncbi:uncharacterized protein LTR77_006555 [Saxophila tyrrhenica]|uniref:Casein kinase II beta 2 subunit n=1 Tax=Saxophila tyrrhenica TaxID=1690608 RepID=A0AAV9P5L5_9PEZI|nr:hypothetical protein LTR77_006555 [Saxophila tyrrhenica]